MFQILAKHTNSIMAAASMLTLLVTAAAATFVGYQAVLLREQSEIMRSSASAPFQSNLQDRIIGACSDFAFHADNARSAVTFWSAFKRKDPEAAPAFDLDEEPIYLSALVSLSELRPKIELISFFSEGETQEKLRSLLSRITEFQIYLSEGEADRKHEHNILEWWDERVSFVRARCRAALVGELKGLI